MSKTMYLFGAVVMGLLALILIAVIISSRGPKDTGKDRVSDIPITLTTMPSQSPVPEANPSPTLNPNISYQAVLNTSVGKITIDLNSVQTPITANNFITLAKSNFYNNTIFHRVISGFMIQGGDPKGDGTGGPGYKFADEPFTGEYIRGTVAMANSGPNTNGSQFFIMHQDNGLPKNYVIFGKVTSGMDTVDKIATASVSASLMGEMSVPVNPAKILSVDIIENPR